LFLQELELQQFRCFEHKKLTFNAPMTLITGNNGSGKTTISEAIYYLCYFKSFRSHVISELMLSGTESFFLKGQFFTDKLAEQHTIQVGYSQKKKSIKFDQKSVASYRELFALFQVVTLTEDDIDLIKGYPAGRRAFIDQAVLLLHPEKLEIYRQFRQILQQRNACFDQYGFKFNQQEFDIWTEKLWSVSSQIQESRQSLMTQIQQIVNQLIDQFFEGAYQVAIEYDAKVLILSDSFDQFMLKIGPLMYQERALKRSMFGAHLDDLIFQIRGKKARIFASRGQQKLISLLCKLSLTLIERGDASKPLLLIDDFISDFDKSKLNNLISFFITCQNQIIITAPFFDSNLKELLDKAHPDVLSIGG
jgi:DNA replication and repair protein RecF